MADEIDRAQERESEFTEDSLKAVRGLVPEERPDLDEDVECEQCGDIIHPLRASKGYVICVSCQTYIEKSNKQYNRRSSRSYDYED